MESKSQTCENPSCESGNVDSKLRCSRCTLVFYCSKNCQLQHWPVHKSSCKSTKDVKDFKKSTSPAPLINPSALINDMIAKLQSLKLELQKCFRNGDFPNAIKVGADAITLSQQIPEPTSTIELIQLHLNMSNAFVQMNNFNNAETHANLSLQLAEKGVIMRENHPHSLDMLSMALTAKAFWLINATKNYTEAEVLAKRALEIAEMIFGSKDQRSHKALRCLGIIKDKQAIPLEAEVYMTKAYMLLATQTSYGNADAHLVLDELSQMLTKNGRIETAEKLMKQNYEMMSSNHSNEEELIFGDCAAKLASILCRQHREAEADPFMRKALEIRERTLGVDSQAAAMTLFALAGITEAQGKPSKDVEDLLMKSHEIFKKLEGPTGVNAVNTLEHIKRMKGAPGNNNNKDILLENLEFSPRSNGPSNAYSNTNSNSKQGALAEEGEFSAEDGVGRMQKATVYFENAKFAHAEILIAEAYEIFLKEFGAEHSSTKAAKQNLQVVRHNGNNQLWNQVVEEVLAKQLLQQAQQQAEFLDDPSSPVSGAGKGTGGDEWLLKEPTRSTECIIC